MKLCHPNMKLCCFRSAFSLSHAVLRVWKGRRQQTYPKLRCCQTEARYADRFNKRFGKPEPFVFVVFCDLDSGGLVDGRLAIKVLDRLNVKYSM